MSLNFQLNLCLLPLCHPLPAALHPPALKFPLLFFMADFSGGALDHLLVHISPIAWKKSSSLLYSKSKIKGEKKKKGHQGNSLSPAYHSSPTWGS